MAVIGLIVAFWVETPYTLKIEAVCFTEMLETTYKITWCHSPENHNLD
jgi:hypothetical protein